MRNIFFKGLVIALAIILCGFLSFRICNRCDRCQQKEIRQHSFAIYIVYHKWHQILKSNELIPIQAGRALKRDFGLTLERKMIGDDTGDNISLKNERYAELTAMYWMWKNARNVDYIGLMHYRKLLRNEFIDSACYSATHSVDLEICNNGLDHKNLELLMNKYDIVIPQKYNFHQSIIQHYEDNHHIEDLDAAVEYIKKHYPKMSIATDNVIHGMFLSSKNIFIMKKELFDEYAAWLFEILFAIENKMSHDNERYNRRAPAFLAERLFNIWIEYNRPKYRIGEIKVVPYFDE